MPGQLAQEQRCRTRNLLCFCTGSKSSFPRWLEHVTNNIRSFEDQRCLLGEHDGDDKGKAHGDNEGDHGDDGDDDDENEYDDDDDDDDDGDD
eukprot:2991828-Karenia_brevis.AAC.1